MDLTKSVYRPMYSKVAELIAVGRVLIDADAHRKTRANEIAQRLLAHAIEIAPDNASAPLQLRPCASPEQHQASAYGMGKGVGPPSRR